MNIALFLSSDSIALAHRQPEGHWAMIGETALDVPDLGGSLAKLRELAVIREGKDFETLLVLPDDQILYTSLTAPTADPELTTFRIEEGLDGLTPYTIAELEYDWRVQEEDRVKIAVVARETLDEARAFAAQYGFTGAGFAAMPPMQRFPGVPLFDLGEAAQGMDFSAEGIAFGPDAFGADEEAEAEAEDDTTAAGAAEDEPDEVADKPATDTEVAETEAETASEAASDTTPVAAAPAAKDEAEDVPDDGDDDEPSSDSPALAEALQMAAAAKKAEPVRPIDDPTQTGPITPNTAEPDEVSDTPIQAAASEIDDDDPDLPPIPSPASAEARQRARALRGEAPARRPESDDSGNFTARRGRIGAPDTERESLIGQRSARIDLAPVERPAAAGPMPSPTAAPKPSSGDNAGAMPRLSEQLQRVRAASQSKPKPQGRAPDAPARMPRVEIEPQAPTTPTGLSAERRPSPFGLSPSDAAEPVEPPDNQPKRGILGGFRRSRRGAPPAATAATATAAPTATASDADADDKAVSDDASFSSGLLARKATPSVGPSFRTGLILTVILLLLLAIVAIWSAIFLPDSPLARLFGVSGMDQAQVSNPLTAPNAPEVVASAPVIGNIEALQPSLEDEAAADGIDLSAQEPLAGAADPQPAGEPPEEIAAGPAPEAVEELPDIDADFDLPPLPPIDPGQNPSVEDAEALYAEDGIWARSPDRPDLRPFDLLDQVYTASIDPAISAFDAVALPDPGVNPGELLRRMPPPPAFGAQFDLTASGMVAPTAEGVLTPEGAFVIAGAPPFAAIPRPRDVAEPVAAIDVDSAVLASFRPAARPEDLSETRERQILGGLTNDELSAVRPPERPVSPQEAAARASLFPGDESGGDPVELESGGAEAGVPEVAGVAEAVAAAIGGTELATARSRFPSPRPANIDQIVASAERAPDIPDTVVVAAAAAAPGPNIPSNADVSRAATERDAIRLRNVNLIGVTGTPSDRRALVRLSSGRFVRVGVGDRLDGGRVAAIGETTLQYVRSGRTVTLEIPG